MEAKLQKWGNSLGIRIPKNLLDSLNLEANDFVELKQDGDKIIMSISKNKKVSLKKLFDNYNGENLSKEFEWDDPVGREIW